jgi:hypothetical protein
MDAEFGRLTRLNISDSGSENNALACQGGHDCVLAGWQIFEACDATGLTSCSARFVPTGGTQVIDAFGVSQSPRAILGVNLLATSDDGLDWTTHTSSVGAFELFAVAQHDNILVAVGSSHTGALVLFSSTGDAWTPASLPNGAGNGLYDVTFAAGLFVAVGQNGALLTSPDGVSWTLKDVGVTADLRSVRYDGTRFLAVGGDHTVLTSRDGVAWTMLGGRPSITALWDVAYADGRFVAVGELAGIWWSTDGASWTAASGQPADAYLGFYGVTYGAAGWVAVGDEQAASSVDGVHWTFGSSEQLGDVTYGPIGGVDRYVALGFNSEHNGLFVSDDGIHWSSYGDAFDIYGGERIEYARGRWVTDVTVGDLRVSADGASWHTVSLPGKKTNPGPYSTTYDTDHWISVGDGHLLTSPDAETWTVVNDVPDFVHGRVFAAGGDLMVVEAGWIINDPESPGITVARSTDQGAHWQSTNTDIQRGTVGAMAYGGGRWIAVGGAVRTGAAAASFVLAYP